MNSRFVSSVSVTCSVDLSRDSGSGRGSFDITNTREKSEKNTELEKLNLMLKFGLCAIKKTWPRLGRRAFSGVGHATSSRRLFASSGLGVAVGSYFSYTQLLSDAAPEQDPENLVSVDSSVHAFPVVTSDYLLQTPFQLLGYGIRMVTFLNMKVYALGIYVAREDLPLLKKTLTSVSPDPSQVAFSLRDPALSPQVVELLLSSGVRFSAKIVPVRNTDFNHLRDGLIKSIKSNPKYKELMKRGDGTDEKLNAGLDQLRKAFGARKMTATKNSTLMLQILSDGKLALSFQLYTTQDQMAEPFRMGVVEEPLIGRLLFMSYLSGAKPLSEPARSKAIDGFISLL
ncbi:hypothetical protein KL935_001712 [Ogataea polymorpha]|nr:hypothetical protein KL937_001128 [Ogataea polymorpha]KAG7890650.1 hypothetical protein KL936_001934 [Ogataea polymorpha]KAG7891175.1 hypothetical protein KL908_003928 [Ogataea polymorpha]KAG7901752.1 hypothetical protein KL935_001712 [Ogataea polymorpha]KAG7910270.1 hypothetical protein KL907_001161 [Ogataea polymorpha]